MNTQKEIKPVQRQRLLNLNRGVFQFLLVEGLLPDIKRQIRDSTVEQVVQLLAIIQVAA